MLQFIITHATDLNSYALMISLDLSAAFDLIDMNLLLKRLRIIGLPMDLVKLNEVWLTGNSSQLYDSESGTIKGSVHGPILYAIFVSPFLT